MTADQKLSSAAAALAEPARAKMLCSLLDGRARTATELAAIADIAASTASSHLTKLRDERLVSCVSQGKHRYYRLAGEDAAGALEALLRLVGQPSRQVETRTPVRLRAARTCYDHAAGELGVGLYEMLVDRAWLICDGEECRLTPAGEVALSKLGVDCSAAQTARRRFAYPCLDWSERRFHLGGALAASLLKAFVANQWLHREVDGRELEVTPAGHRQLQRLGIALA